MGCAWSVFILGGFILFLRACRVFGVGVEGSASRVCGLRLHEGRLRLSGFGCKVLIDFEALRKLQLRVQGVESFPQTGIACYIRVEGFQSKCSFSLVSDLCFGSTRKVHKSTRV